MYVIASRNFNKSTRPVEIWYHGCAITSVKNVFNNNIIKCYENWHSLEEEQLLCVMETLSAAIVRAKSYGKGKFNWVTERMHVQRTVY